MSTDKYKFKKGQRLPLDHICDIQGLAGGRWWDHFEDEATDEVLIVKDVEIEVRWRVKE